LFPARAEIKAPAAQIIKAPQAEIKKFRLEIAAPRNNAADLPENAGQKKYFQAVKPVLE
jgi:hypothetical protein